MYDVVTDSSMPRPLPVSVQHPYLHKILKIDYRYETKQIIIVQPYMASGSLKDMIYKVRNNNC